MSETLAEKVFRHTIRDWLYDPPDVDSVLATKVTDPLVRVLSAGLGVVAKELDFDLSIGLRAAFAIDPQMGDESVARHIANRLRPLLPGKTSVASPSAPAKPPPPPPPPPPSQPGLPAERWTMDFLAMQFEKWRAQLREFEKTCETEDGRTAITYLRAEMDFETVDVPHRQLIAEMIAAGGRWLGFRGSSRVLGTMVHRELQRRYITTRWYETVVSEWYVHTYENGYQVKRTISEHNRVVLKRSGNRDPTYMVVEHARLTPFAPSPNYLLWDLMDMINGQIWEIKPLGGAREGVIQETYYRLAYTLEATRWLCLGYEPSIDHLVGGASSFPMTDPHTGELLIRTYYSEALPFTVEALPGMVLYTVLPRPRSSLEDALEKIRELIEAVAHFVQKIRQVLKILAAIIRIIALIIIILMLLQKEAPPPGGDSQPPKLLPPAGGEEKVPNIGIPEKVPVRALQITSVPSGGLVVRVQDDRSVAPRAGGLGDKPVAVHLGKVTIDGIPVDQVGSFTSRIAYLLSRSLDAFEQASSADGGRSPSA